MVRLNRTHSFVILSLQANFSKIFQNYALSFGKNFQRIMQILHNLPTYPTNNAKFAPFMYPLYLMFQIPAMAENAWKFQRIKQNSLHLPTDSVNDAKFAPFIYPLYIMFQMPGQWQRTL